jgi:hypothetical protein
MVTPNDFQQLVTWDKILFGSHPNWVSLRSALETRGIQISDIADDILGGMLR